MIPTIADYAARVPTPATDAPAISVVTVCWNSAATIARTIASVQAQIGADGAPVPTEHLFIDGGSTDATLDIIHHHLRPGDRLLSERDGGISDAINKGIALAGGRHIAILHSDDWLDQGQLAAAAAATADIVFGNVILYVDGLRWFEERGDPDYARIVHNRMPSVPHPSMLIARAVFERVGLYRGDLKLAMDYEWLLRATVAGEAATYAPAVTAHMTLDGVSNTRWWATMREVTMIAESFGLSPWRARPALWARGMKTGTGAMLRRAAPKVYQGLRQRLNPQFVA
jgi:glycosyltransferase involved in cell wall biosynthesis